MTIPARSDVTLCRLASINSRMTRSVAGATIAVFTLSGISGLRAAAPAFEVASIKPAPPQPAGSVSTRISIDRARAVYSNLTVKDLIGEAYRVQEYQITGPALLGSRRFDIAAKIPDGVSKPQVPEMLQALLADRFRLAFHRETKILPVYALTVGKNGAKLKPAENASGISSNSNRTGMHVDAKVSLLSFAEFLSVRLGRPVLDRTGLSGAFDIKADWAVDPLAQPLSPEKETAADSAAGPSVFTALEQQLGLKLEATRGPVEILVIDHVEQPSEN